MGEVAIRAEGLGKQYRLGEQQRHDALRDVLVERLKRPLRGFRRPGARRVRGASPEGVVWALRDVTFDIKRGEVVGIVGRNGAGKSTLLKILSRITEPTEGQADVYGRTGSLLEVGTGFHPELTGRENVYLNGAILGMRRSEISRKFDEIVSFAEVEKFIDTPVKRYSSGMYVRLAFAVAVHLDTEILTVDEVLAVGDAQFQKKCFAKMRAVRNDGRTILFVSHNLAALRTICQRGVLLEHGALTYTSRIDDVVDRYLAGSDGDREPAEAARTESFEVWEVRATSATGEIVKTFDTVDFEVEFTARRDIHDPGLYLSFLTPDNFRIAGLDFKDFATIPPVRAGQTVVMGFRVTGLPLMPGSYLLEVHLKDMATFRVEHVPKHFPFDVSDSAVYGGRELGYWFGVVGLRAEPVFRGVR